MSVDHPLRQGKLVTIINPSTGKPWMIERHDSTREYRSEALVEEFETSIPAEPPNPPRFHEARMPR
jgi:hypothetical protein